jgi:ABC-type Na+ efflux pump permease subunit
MTRTTSLGEAHARSRFRVWHLWLLALFVAVALANIRDQGRDEPTLVALAAVGFALYGLIGWGAWIVAGRSRARLGATAALALYLVAMAIIFLVATAVYLVIEHAYLFGV